MTQQHTEDRIAVQDVMLTYTAAVDERDLERYTACFAADVDVFGFGGQVFRGRDAWVDYVSSALDRYAASQHLLGPMLATIEGDRARTRTPVQALHFLAGDAGGRLTLWGTYRTDMRRIDGRWQITRHELDTCGSSTD